MLQVASNTRRLARVFIKSPSILPISEQIQAHYVEADGNTHCSLPWRSQYHCSFTSQCSGAKFDGRVLFALGNQQIISQQSTFSSTMHRASFCSGAGATEAGPTDAVKELYEKMLKSVKDQRNAPLNAWSNIAGLFMESGDLNRALQYYKEAVKLKPTFSDAYLNLGNVYKALGMPQEAIVCYQRALQARPDYALAFGNLASIFYEQGNMDMTILNYK